MSPLPPKQKQSLDSNITMLGSYLSVYIHMHILYFGEGFCVIRQIEVVSPSRPHCLSVCMHVCMYVCVHVCLVYLKTII